MDNLVYTTITPALCKPVAELLASCFPGMPPSEKYLTADLDQIADLFAEGTIVVLDGARVVGVGTGIFVDVDPDNLPPTENELLDDENGTLHSVNGSHYFGGALAVDPEYRNQGIARQLYDRRKEVVIRHNKEGFYAASLMPDYSKHQSETEVDAYVDQVIAGNIFDPVLTIQLNNGFHVVKLLEGFVCSPGSHNWSALIYWANPG